MRDLNCRANSKDTIEIEAEAGGYIVRKTFSSDVARGRRNIAKQQTFGPVAGGGGYIRSAGIISVIEDDLGLTMRMPYIEGITGSDFAIYGTRQIGETVSESLSSLLYHEIAQSQDQLIDREIFLRKAADVATLLTDPVLRRLASEVSSRLNALPEKILIPMGNCHGDLTLSNVIVNAANGVTLIDFLDTFLETPLQDLAKVNQDYLYGWSFRQLPAPLAVKGRIWLKRMRPRAVTQIARIYPEGTIACTLLTLLRVGPYIRDECTNAWLQNSLTQCLKEEDLCNI